MPGGTPVRILLVEDDPEDAVLLQDLLRDWHLHRFEAAIAADLAEAAKLLADCSFDAVITDLGLGPSQGLETLERLLRVAGKMPVIVLTGLDGDAFGLRAVEMGAQAYLEKDRLEGRQAAQVILHAIQRAGIVNDLRRARHKAEASQAARTDFLATLSHELRQPLNGILGYVQLLEMAERGEGGPAQDSPERRLAYCCAIRESADHMLSLINDILDYAQAEGGHLSLTLEPVALPAVLREAATSLAPEAQRRGIAIDLPVPEAFGPTRVCADGRRLRQVFLNLLSNAVRFSPEGSVVKVTPAALGMLHGCSIADAGPGMDSSEIAVALEPFGQVHRNSGGTGLGLPFCQRVVDLHGGQLTIDSMRGQGTTVTILLPAAAPASADTSDEQVRGPSGGAAAQGQAKTEPAGG